MIRIFLRTLGVAALIGVVAFPAAVLLTLDFSKALAQDKLLIAFVEACVVFGQIVAIIPTIQ